MPQTRSQAILVHTARTSGWIVIVIGAAVVAGWLLSVERLVNLSSGLVATHPLSAILLILSGLVLHRRLNHQNSGNRKPLDWVALGCALIVAAGGAFKTVEYLAGFEINVSSMLFSKRLSGAGLMVENQIAPSSSLNFLLCGMGLLLLDVETRRGIRPAQLCFLVAALVSFVALIGYAYSVLPFYSIGSAIPMAMATAVALQVLSLAGLAARPERGLMRVISSDTIAGATARRLLPAAILIPVILGWFCLSGEKRGWFEMDFGVSLFALACMVFVTVLIWWNSRLLFGAEQARLRIERRLAVQYGATRVLAESPDVNGATDRIVQTVCEQLGWQAGGLWRVVEKVRLIRCEMLYVTSSDLSEFAESTRKLSFSIGTGLPGRVWELREPVWIEDISTVTDFSGALALEKWGVRSVIGFPIRYNATVCGVMQFFSSKIQPRDEALLQTLSAVGSQIGQFIERKLAHEQLKQTSSNLARSNMELQEFAYVTSHDLSEPLRMIASYLQLLEERHGAFLNPEAREFIGYAVDGAERMHRMIQDLLAYARVESRGQEFCLVDCESIVSSAIQNLKVAIGETHAVIEHDTLPTVTGDSVQLTQVFQNLISNAIKFRGKTSPRIRVSVERKEQEWLFTVKDNGIGIDQKNFDRVFVLFQRLHTRQEYSGTGIGLAVCKKIIDRHGGRIWIESQPGQGTAVFFTIPMHS
jgi:signal transduction histidine kinase